MTEMSSDAENKDLGGQLDSGGDDGDNCPCACHSVEVPIFPPASLGTKRRQE